MLALSFYIFTFILYRSFCLFRAFDVELLYIAQRLGIPIAEVPVNWQEIDGIELYILLFIYYY